MSESQARPGAAPAWQGRPCLRIDQVSMRYGKRLALDAVDTTVAAGEFCVILGPNGAGKSTLFQILTGLFTPVHGDVTVDGLSIRREPVAALARIGVVFQSQSLDLDLTARRNLQFHADLHGLPAATARERIEHDSARLGLSGDLDRPVRQLSGGTRRKVELVRALLHRPALLLMDEATVGLDPKSRKDLITAVQDDARTRGTAVLWSTHWVEETQDADRVLVLHEGVLVAQGTPEQVRIALGQPTLELGFIARTQKGAPKAPPSPSPAGSP